MRTPSLFLFGTEPVRQSIAVASATALVATGLTVGVAVSPANAAVSDSSYSQTFAYTGASEVFTVPQGVLRVAVVGAGAGGGAGDGSASKDPRPGGYGAYVQAALPVTDVDQVSVTVGGQGTRGSRDSKGGYNGGGSGSRIGHAAGGGGGGATTITKNGQPIYIASGGGGGGGAAYGAVGGEGGVGSRTGEAGGNGGGNLNETGGAAGHQPDSNGGAGGAGASAYLGDGGAGGGGGGGYKGGSGGKGGDAPTFNPSGGGGGGGGGSSYVSTDATHVSYDSASSGYAMAAIEWRAIETKSLPDVVDGIAYSAQLKEHGNAKYDAIWSVSQGTLPNGLHLDGSTGLISGDPSSNQTESRTVTFRVTDEAGAVSEQQITFDIHTVAPVIKDLGVSDLTQSSATGQSSVTTESNGLNDIRCELSTHSNMSSSVEVEAEPESVEEQSADVSTECSFTGLESNTSYFYRFVGIYGASTVDSGSVMSFKTPAPIQPAEIFSGPAIDITQSTATGRGMAVSGASELQDIECAVSQSEDMSSPILLAADPVSVDAVSHKVVACHFTGLMSGTDYYYQIRGSDTEGVLDSGAPVKFATLKQAPTEMTVQPATNIGQTTATGHGTILAVGYDLAEVKCQVAPQNGVVAEVNAFAVAATNPEAATSLSCSFTDLAPGTRYAYRIVDQDDDDAIYSNVEWFTTQAASKRPVAPKPPKKKQQLRAGAIPKKVKFKGVTLMNKKNATTRQGVALKTRVSKVRAKCLRVVKGKQRRISVKTFGRCTFSLKVTYTAAGTSKYLPLKIMKTYRVKG